MNTYKRYQYPSEIISHAVWLYHRFTLSLRDIEELLAARHVTVPYEPIRQWSLKIGPRFSRKLEQQSNFLAGDHWFLDEVFISIKWQTTLSLASVDQDNQTIDILVQTKRNRHAAAKFFRKLLKTQGPPSKSITDKLRSYTAAMKDIGLTTSHDTQQYHKNLDEISHQPTR